MLKEMRASASSGWLMSFLLLAGLVLLPWGLVVAARAGSVAGVLGATLGLLLDVLLWMGLTVVHRNEARVVQLFGRYTGTLRDQGFWWVNPFTVRRKVSMRVRNFESAKLKVNDHDGNPIEIAAVVVWKVVDTAE